MNLLSFKTFLAGLLLFFLFFGLQEAKAQQKYWVVLRDKKGVSFNPYAYFDKKAIERRRRQNLPLFDETDKPLNSEYFRQVSALADSVSGSSRWLNAVACFARPEQLKALQQLPFVREIIPFQVKTAVLAQFAESDNNLIGVDKLKLLDNQTASLGAEYFKEKQLDGKGIRIAVLDAGFTGVNTQAGFEHLRKDNRILKTWDFVKRREYVYDYATHGTMVLSCIGGKMGDHPVGLATGAEFLLARTERMHSEHYSEEENWLAAMEWADKNGADIINSSLGYTYQLHFIEEMNGRASLVARAAGLAARKGILVVNANGNDGSSDSWKILGAPADGDSVLAVGGIDPENLYHVSFSSYGPTTDKRMKPNVAAFGIVLAIGPNGPEQTQGTSFSSPLVAGFAACAWQSNRQLTNMQLFRKIEESGHLYPYFDYAHGFGVPQAQNFLEGKSEETLPTLSFELTGTQLSINIKKGFMPDTSAADSNLKKLLVPGRKNKTEDYVFYHIANTKGYLDRYYVVRISNNPEAAVINLSAFRPGTKVRAFYKGYTGTFTY